MRRYHLAWPHLAAIVVLGLCAYANTFSVPFYLDDEHVIVENPLIRALTNFAPSSSQAALIRDGRPIWPEYRARVVVMFTFALNYAVHGLDVAGYHAANLAVHLVNGGLVYLLAAVLLRAAGLAEAGGLARFGPLVAAGLFVAHPIQTQAITYVSQRFASMAALFYLLALVTYIAARKARESGRAAIAYTTSLVAAGLAMLSKENAFTLIAAIALYELLFEHAALRIRAARLGPFAGVTMFAAWWAIRGDGQATLAGLASRAANLSGSVVGLSRWDYLATQCRVIVTYLRLLVMPIQQNLDYDYPVARSFLDPAVALSLALSASAIGLAAWLVWRTRARHDGWRVLAFGIFWFYVTLAVESSVIPIADLIFEHRLYLPSAGLIIGLVGAGLETRRRWASRIPDRWMLAIAVGVVATLAIATYSRNAVWRDEIALWEDTVRKSPRKARPRNNLGIAYDKAGRRDEAIRQYRAALRIEPGYAEAHQNLAVAYDVAGLAGEALREMQIVTQLDPTHAAGHYNLGVLYERVGDLGNALESYRTAARLTPFDDKVHANLGVSYAKLGRTEDAIRALERSIELRRDNPVARSNLGLIYHELGRLAEAEREYRAALAVAPDDERARRGLARLEGSRR